MRKMMALQNIFVRYISYLSLMSIILTLQASYAATANAEINLKKRAESLIGISLIEIYSDYGSDFVTVKNNSTKYVEFISSKKHVAHIIPGDTFSIPCETTNAGLINIRDGELRLHVGETVMCGDLILVSTGGE